MIEIELRDLEGLLGPKLKENQCFTYTTKPLLGTGENYGSTMLSVDVKTFEKDKLEEAVEHHYVAKMCPPSEFLQGIFNTPVTYKKELGLYTHIVPLLQKFQREHGVEEVMGFFSKLEASRVSLDSNSDQVDNDAVMLFRNLKYEGYELCDRFKGFDLECAELIMKDLAVFHAVPVAFKREKPEEFKDKIYPLLKWSFEFNLDEEVEKQFFNVIEQTAEKDEESSLHIANVKKAFAHGKHCYANRLPVREPFATITHNDYWLNNTMIRFDKNKKPIKNVMLDFQVIEYGSPAEDVIFFVYSSVNPKTLNDHYSHLINLYYTTFINTLKELKCDTGPFTFTLFQEELEISSRSLQFYHLLVMLPAIFTVKGVVKDLSELNEEEMLKTSTKTSEEFPEKVWSIIRDFGRKGWLQGF